MNIRLKCHCTNAICIGNCAKLPDWYELRHDDFSTVKTIINTPGIIWSYEKDFCKKEFTENLLICLIFRIQPTIIHQLKPHKGSSAKIYMSKVIPIMEAIWLQFTTFKWYGAPMMTPQWLAKFMSSLLVKIGYMSEGYRRYSTYNRDWDMGRFKEEDNIGYLSYTVAANCLKIWAKDEGNKIVNGQLWERNKHFLNFMKQYCNIKPSKEWSYDKVINLNNPEIFVKFMARYYDMLENGKIFTYFIPRYFPSKQGSDFYSKHNNAIRCAFLMSWKRLNKKNISKKRDNSEYNLGDFPLETIKMIIIRLFELWQINMDEKEYKILS